MGRGSGRVDLCVGCLGGERDAFLSVRSCLGFWVRWGVCWPWVGGPTAQPWISPRQLPLPALNSLDPCALHLQPKGADRKQKTDREKMEKRTAQEKEKYQPSYETTILSEVSRPEPCARGGEGGFRSLEKCPFGVNASTESAR